MEDALKIYLKEVNRIKPATSEENKELFIRYKNGEDVYNEIYEKNLKLVVKFATNYAKKYSIDVLDAIQEGNIGLLTAIKKYDLSFDTSFSTYAYHWISQAITRAYKSKEQAIAIPENLYTKHNKIKEYIEEKEKEGKKPTNEQIMKDLNITKNTLESFFSYKGVLSLDQPIEEDMTLEAIIGIEENYYEIESNYDLKIYLYKMKHILTDIEYFCTYNSYINNLSKRQIAKMLMISHQLVQMHIKNSLEKIRKELKRNKKTPSIKEIEKEDLKPLNIETYILFKYLKRVLTEEEYYIYYNMKRGIKIVEENNVEKTYMKVSKIEKEFLTLPYEKRYDLAKQNEYVSSLFKIEPTYKPTTIKELYDNFKDKTYEEVLNENKEYIEKLSYQQIELLKKFFRHDISELTRQNIKDAELEINLMVLGYRKNTYINFETLFKTYKENKYLFKPKEKQTIEKFFYSSKQTRKQYYNPALEKLEKIYFGIPTSTEINLKNQDISDILKRYPKRFSEEEKELLTDVYFLKQTRKKIEKKYNLTRQQLTDKIKKLKIRIFNLKYELTEINKVNNEIYIKYLKDPYYDIKNRNLALEHFEKGKTYEQLEKEFNMSKYKISNSIMDIVRRIDQYRFKIVIPTYITEKELEEMKIHFTDIEINQIKDFYINHMDINEIYKKYNINQNKTRQLLQKARLLVDRIKTKGIEVAKEDYVKELNCHITDSVLDERERIFISYFYGIKYEENKEGKKLTKEEILSKLNISENILNHLKAITKLKIQKRKIGLLVPIYGHIKKEKLEEILKDKNLPITLEDRFLLENIKGINPGLSIEELSSKLNISKKSIPRKYNRAILNILKYKENEKNGTLSYEKDIKPLLKYFSKYDRNLIELYFNQNKTYEQLTKLTKETMDTIINRISIIKRKIMFLKVEHKETFDFDYARKVIEDETLPFYSNKELIKKIYELKTGESGEKPLSYPEIIKKLNINISLSTICKIFDQFLLAVCKHKIGVRKEKELTKEEIRYFYENTKLKEEEKQIFVRYLSKKTSSQYNMRNSKLDNINYIILKYQNKLPINMTKKEDLEEALKYNLSQKTRKTVLSLLGKTEQDSLSGKEIEKIIRILTPIYLKEKEKIKIKS